MTAAQELQELRTRVGSELTTIGSGPLVKAGVQSMANLPLPLTDKYRKIDAEAIVRCNTAGSSRAQVVERMGRLVKALSVLEKYGCNLTNPIRPRYWRSVKHNNPIFKSQVDGMQGGRGILFLYGYTVQQVDGLVFPDDVPQPDRDKVAVVTLEVMCLRLEVDMLIKGTHPHPEFFKDVIPLVVPEVPTSPTSIPTMASPMSPTSPTSITVVLPPKPAPRLLSRPPPGQEPQATPLSPPPSDGCNVCGADSTVTCLSCSPRLFCDACDGLYHRNPTRANHKRQPIQPVKKEDCSICGILPVDMDCTICVMKFCLNCDTVYHRHPERSRHERTAVTPSKATRSEEMDFVSLLPWACSHCSVENSMQTVLCHGCDRPRLAAPCPRPQEDPPKLSLSLNTEWQCSSCTVINKGCNVLCGVCDRPRLATRPSVTTPTLPSPKSRGATPTQWTCQSCTFRNPATSAACEMCTSPSEGGGGVAPGLAVVPAQTPAKDPPQPLNPDELLDQKRQTTREDSLGLIKHIKVAEKKGFTPEEVCAALVSCGGSNIDPCDWLGLELPHLLDQICAMATSSVKLNYNAVDSGAEGATEANGGTAGPRSPNEVVGGAEMKLSRAEAKQAWLDAGGDLQKAVKRLLRDRKAKMRELRSLGFQDEERCQEVLQQSGGQIREALPLLQWPLLEPFHQRINANQSEALIDAQNPDRQRTCRRLLAFYGLPSWGRCELALSLLQEEGVEYTLEDVVQAVKESQDREFICRILQTECMSCTGLFPRNKVQSLISCQCVICHACFKQFFELAVKERHVMDMVCQFCTSLDINDPEQTQTYFSTLDIQLRDCLDSEVFEIYSKKMMEYTMMKDPKFLWCCHCSFGFLYEGDQLKVHCFDCKKSFCAKCKKPWEPQHQDLSCEMFLRWKRDNDPEWQKQGLAGFLLENGITCPSCSFQYALAKGGCMHFTCGRCKHQFCSGCNMPFHKALCKNIPCGLNCLHAHHPRDCLFYMRDWPPARLQELLQRNGVAFNTDPPADAGNDACSVMTQKEEGVQLVDMACGVKTEPGQAGLCEKHYREYLVSLINDSSLDPAPLYEGAELTTACQRYNVVVLREENEEEAAYNARQLEKLQEVPLGEKVPRRK
ncbi:unnamed protein product [Lota lota]